MEGWGWETGGKHGKAEGKHGVTEGKQKASKRKSKWGGIGESGEESRAEGVSRGEAGAGLADCIPWGDATARRVHKPMHTDGLQKLEKARKWILL